MLHLCFNDKLFLREEHKSARIAQAQLRATLSTWTHHNTAKDMNQLFYNLLNANRNNKLQ